jgi:hypothetical protein
MRVAILLCLLVASALASPIVRADWTQTGVAVVCDPDGGRFVVVSEVTSSDSDAEVRAPAIKQGKYLPITLGLNRVTCRLSSRYRITANIQNIAPGLGVGSGSGYVQIEGLWLNNVRLIGIAGFNEVDVSSGTLVTFEIRTRLDAVEIISCIFTGYESERHDPAKTKCTNLTGMPANPSLERP